MLSIYKIWTAATTQAQWTLDLENYIMAHKPTTHHELETLINQYHNQK